MELSKIPIDFENLTKKLIEIIPAIYAVAIIGGNNMIVYSTDNWEISGDLGNVCTSWESKKAPSIIISGVKYTVLECEVDSLVATSVKGAGHIVGCKNDQWKIITYVEPNGDIKAAIVEISRTLADMSSKEPPMRATGLDPSLITEIETFLKWIKSPEGLRDYINYYLEQDNTRIITELAKIYKELIEIIT